MKKNKVTITAREDKDSIFPNADGIYERYHSLRDKDPYKNKREKFQLSYDRKPWMRGGKGIAKNKLDPNFGQFKAKIDSAVGTFTQVLSERALTVRIVPKYCKRQDVKKLSSSISGAFHRYFIKPWEDRYLIDTYASFDMIMEGKAIEHWATKGCVYTESVPVSYVFPDSNAGPDPRKWSYVFIEVNYTIPKLEKMLKLATKKGSQIPDSSDNEYEVIFNAEYLREILKNPQTFNRIRTNERTDVRNNGEISQNSRDYNIPIVFAYVKEDFSDDMSVSLYCFPAEFVKPDKSQSTDKSDHIKYLYKKKNYCKCISNHVANRCYQITRNWWTCNSFAEQIYLCCALYDKSMSLVIRAAKRNSILYFASDNPNTVQNMLNQNDDEVQHIAADVKYITTAQNTNIREVIETTRQIMIDTENGQSLAQAPGSQNVKGYAITAEETRMRAQGQSESETMNIKMLMCGDVSLWKEIYRRALAGEDPDFDEALKSFKEELKDLNIDPKWYKFDNLYFEPSFLNGGSQSSRISNATGVAGALAIDPKNSGQEQAQRDLVAAYVGTDNVDSYITDQTEIIPAQMKAGGENEDLDNAYVNPRNVPVLKDDLHMQEIPIHLIDYELKLTAAEQMMAQADASANPVKKVLFLSMAHELIKAQDNKGAHINAHLQMVENNPLNQQMLSQIVPRYQAVQKKQDAMVEGIEKVMAALDEQMATSSLNDEKTRHAQTMNQLTETHAKTMNEIGLDKSLQQRQSGLDRNEDSRQATLAKTGIDLAAKEQQSQIALSKQENEAFHHFRKAGLKAKEEDTKAAAAAKPSPTPTIAG